MPKSHTLSILFLLCCTSVMSQQFVVNLPTYYRSKVIYTISMPITNIDTRYNVDIAAAPLPSDTTHLQHRYFITYSTPDRTDIGSEHITFDDSLYRNNGKVLFADATHHAIVQAIEQQHNDTLTHITIHNDTIVDGVEYHTITATRYCNDDIACRNLYVVDATTRQPLLFRRENNPGMPTIQTIEARYIAVDTTQYDYKQWVELQQRTSRNNH